MTNIPSHTNTQFIFFICLLSVPSRIKVLSTKTGKKWLKGKCRDRTENLNLLIDLLLVYHTQVRSQAHACG